MTEAASVPDILRSIRSNLDLTQVELAERLGVSFATVNRWEGGGNKPQKAAMASIVALADEAGIDIDVPRADTAVMKPGRARRSAAAPTTKPMEQMLWDAACSIRGEKDAPKFKDYLLPLLFLKRLSDVFDDEIGRLAEEYGDRDVALEIAESDHELVRFYLPPEARWAVVSGRSHYEWPLDDRGRSTAPKDIGEHLTKAVRAVVRYNPSLAGVIDVVDFAAERNGERDINPAKLRGVVETFSDPRYRLGLADVQPDFLGRAYEYLLRKFAEGSGQSAGEFFTPTEVGYLMARIMRPKPGETCHDYACGSGGLLIKLQLIARELDPTSKVPLKMAGQELQAESYAVARMNTIIHDMDVELQRGDTMINPKFRTGSGALRRYDIVVANPMWNQPFAVDIFENDPFDRFTKSGGVTSGKGDWAWLQHTIAVMNDGGRAAVVLDTGAMTRGSGSKNEDKERNIRKWFVDRDLIEGVILLPDNLFYNTSAAGVIVVLNKRKPASRKGKIVLVNASQRFTKGKPKNHIASTDVELLAKHFLAADDADGEVRVIALEDAQAADYNLSPSRWVVRSAENNHRPIKEIVSELLALDAQARKVDDALAERVAEAVSAADWPTKPLGELFEIGAGKTMSAAARSGDNQVPFLRTSNVFWDRLDLTTLDTMSLSPQELAEKSLRPGDLLVCEGGEIGRAAIWDGSIPSVTFQNHLHRLRPRSDDVEPRFYVFFLQSAFTQLGIFEGAGNKTTIPNLSASRLAALEVPHPPLPIQRTVVAALGAVRTASAVHEQAVRAAQELYESLLHKVMSGDTGVDEGDVSALPPEARDEVSA